MKKVKIIHILSHIPPDFHKKLDPNHYFSNPEKGLYHKINYPPYWVGFFQDHHVLAAQDLLSLTNEFEVECWRPYGHGIKEIHEENINGIKQKVFPAYKKTYRHFGDITWSNELFNELIKEITNNKVLLNISVGHAWFHIKLMLKLKKYKRYFGLIALHRSGGFRHTCYMNIALWKRFFKWYYFLESYIDGLSLKYSDIYYIGAKPEADYVKQKKKKIKSEYFVEGIDFEKYRVLKHSEKVVLRDELNLPKNKILLIAYGNWISNDYGYHHLIDVFGKIKKTQEGNNLELIMIGGYKSQDLCEMGIKAGAIMVEKVTKTIFIKYLEASDFFAQACFSWGFIQWGGFGTAMIEALACGLPVISGNIIHFPGTSDEREKIGKNMKSPEELLENIIYIKNNLNKYDSCRILAKKYYDLNNTRMTLLNKYRELTIKYYGDNNGK